jgi:hypothetical protein
VPIQPINQGTGFVFVVFCCCCCTKQSINPGTQGVFVVVAVLLLLSPKQSINRGAVDIVVVVLLLLCQYNQSNKGPGLLLSCSVVVVGTKQSINQGAHGLWAACAYGCRGAGEIDQGVEERVGFKCICN